MARRRPTAILRMKRVLWPAFGFKRPLLAIAVIFCAANNVQAFCFKEAAARYNVSELLLKAIAKTESGMKANAYNCNTNGTCDIGVMQINTVHLNQLKQFNIDVRRLYDPCTNVNVGAWILSQNIAIFGRKWQAVGAYNTGAGGAPAAQRIYVSKVHRNYIALGGQ